jgi:integrase
MGKVFLGKDKGWRFCYIDVQGKRRTFYLSSKHSRESATEIMLLVENLVSAQIQGKEPSRADAERLRICHVQVRKTLISHGLIEPTLDEKIPTLGKLCELVCKTKSRLDSKTLLAYQRNSDYLIDYYSEDKRIDLISSTDAELHITWLMTERKPPLSGGTISRSIRSFRTIFKFAIKSKWLTLNPYSEVKGGCVRDEERVEFVEESTVQKVIAACPNDELRLILVLSRYAGLRPHEIRSLKFEHFRIDEPIPYFEIPVKTKTGFRQVPYFPEIRPYFEAVRSAASPEQEFVLEYYRHHTNWGTAIAKVAKKAGVRMWKKAFNNPRSSRTTELDAKGTPQSTMGAVFGNTEKVRKIHYLQFQQQKEFAKLLGMMETDLKKEPNVGDQEHFLADFS